MARTTVSVVITILAVIGSWLGLASSAALGATPSAGGAVYTYEGHSHTLARTYGTAERGPPVGTPPASATYDVVDRWSHGALARLANDVSGRTTTSATASELAQVADAMASTREDVRFSDPSCVVIEYGQAAANGVRLSAGEGLERAPGAFVRNVGPHENMGALCEELCSLTYASGREHALVNTSSGFQIHAGGATGIDLSSDVTQVLAHTHPYHLPALGPSADDVAMLSQLGQSTSILLEHGQTILFGRGGTIAWR
jgi:hypothetical protein